MVNNKWVAWVAVIALVVAVVALILVINGNMTGNVVFGKTASVSSQSYLKVPLEEGKTTGPFPYKNEMYSMWIDFISHSDVSCVKVGVKKGFTEGSTAQFCEGQTTVYGGLKFSIDYVNSDNQVIVRIQ